MYSALIQYSKNDALWKVTGEKIAPENNHQATAMPTQYKWNGRYEIIPVIKILLIREAESNITNL